MEGMQSVELGLKLKSQHSFMLIGNLQNIILLVQFQLGPQNLLKRELLRLSLQTKLYNFRIHFLFVISFLRNKVV